jgi:predicted transcriptional regulator
MTPPKLPKRLKKSKKVLKELRDNEIRSRRLKERDALIQRAVELYGQGLIQVRIANELKVTQRMVAQWLKNAGVHTPRKKKQKATASEQDIATTVPLVDEFEQKLSDTVDESIESTTLEERDKEMEALLEAARNQSSPADKYQAYVAAAGMRMLRDNLLQVRGPRTIREMSELDQLIRRNLGLNPKQGSGGSAGGLTIDISILNNTKADRKHSVIKVRGKMVDAEEADTEVGDLE